MALPRRERRRRSALFSRRSARVGRRDTPQHQAGGDTEMPWMRSPSALVDAAAGTLFGFC